MAPFLVPGTHPPKTPSAASARRAATELLSACGNETVVDFWQIDGLLGSVLVVIISEPVSLFKLPSGILRGPWGGSRSHIGILEEMEFGEFRKQNPPIHRICLRRGRTINRI